MDDQTRTTDADRDSLQAGRGSHWRRVGWRSIATIADGLITRLLKQRAANDNEPAGH